MAKKKSNKFVFKGFIPVHLTVDQLHQLETFGQGDPSELDDHITVIIEHGWKIGFSYNDFTGASMASLTCKDEASIYYGYCFTLQHAEISRMALACRWIVEDGAIQEQIVIPDTGKQYQW